MDPVTASGSVHSHPNPTATPAAQDASAREMDLALFGSMEPGFMWNADADIMDFFSQPLGLDYNTWLQGFDDLIAESLPLINGPEAMSNAVKMMKEYFRQKSATTTSSFDTDVQNQSWFSAPPRLDMYDPQMINVLPSLAKKHLASTFTIFEQVSSTAEALIIAMAAVGALYCDVEGSYKVAKALYNDARRITLATTLSSVEPGFDERLILLQMYGLCSGDGRSFEFVEAFNGCTLECSLLASEGTIVEHRSSTVRSLRDAVQILDCYRVNMLQRPPALFGLIGESSHSNSNSIRDLSQIVDLFDPTSRTTSSVGSLRELAIIATFTWFASVHGPSCTSGPQVWKTDFIELTLHRWYSNQSRQADPWSVILYHLSLVNLHANIALLQRQALEIAKTGTISSNEAIFVSIKEWLRARKFQNARWNAEKLLSIAHANLGIQHWSINHDTHRSVSGQSRDQAREPPHLSFAIFYASLILWSGGVLEGNEKRMLCRIQVEAGARLLMHLKVRVAKKLSSVLLELLV